MNHRSLLGRYPFEFIGLLAVVLGFGCAPTPPEVQRRAPHLGEHTEDVLREAGCDDAHIAALTPARP